ncbi:hypothetical protein BHM03_00015425 [Ensete ventricosum]|nr:hypothetical protein BHM03_00015425 [Ensete ventricosum]
MQILGRKKREEEEGAPRTFPLLPHLPTACQAQPSPLPSPSATSPAGHLFLPLHLHHRRCSTRAPSPFFLPYSCRRPVPPKPQPPPTGRRCPYPRKPPPPLLLPHLPCSCRRPASPLLLPHLPLPVTVEPLRHQPRPSPTPLPLATIAEPYCRSPHPCHPCRHCFLSLGCFFLCHPPQFLLFITAGHPCHLPLQPTVATSFSQPPAALGCTHPHGHHLFLAFPLLTCSSPAAAATRRGPLPAILPRCHCFPAASSTLLLPPTPSSSPSAHSSVASASRCRSTSVPLSFLPPLLCCRNRLQPCPPHLLPFAATSAATRCLSGSHFFFLIGPSITIPLPYPQTHASDSTVEKRIEHHRSTILHDDYR